MQRSLSWVALAVLSLVLFGCGEGSSGGDGSQPAVVITGRGGSYVLQATNLKNVGAMDITIGYNNSTLANPVVTQEGLLSGAIMVTNITVQGIVRVGIINATGISGSGALLSINLDLVGDKPGQLTSLSVAAYDINRNTIALRTAILE